MTAIFDIIQKMHEKFLSYEGYQRALVEKHWEEIVGSSAKRHSYPRKILDKILYISVDSSVWNQSLFMEKKRLIEKINHRFPKQIVIDLKFQIGDEGNSLSMGNCASKVKEEDEEGMIRKNTMDLLVLKALQQKEEIYQKNKCKQIKE